MQKESHTNLSKTAKVRASQWVFIEYYIMWCNKLCWFCRCREILNVPWVWRECAKIIESAGCCLLSAFGDLPTKSLYSFAPLRRRFFSSKWILKSSLIQLQHDPDRRQICVNTFQSGSQQDWGCLYPLQFFLLLTSGNGDFTQRLCISSLSCIALGWPGAYWVLDYFWRWCWSI